MKSDVKGCSTAQEGQEHYESFVYGRRNFVQYDYRDLNGKLFSCVASDLLTARMKRNQWIKENNIN